MGVSLLHQFDESVRRRGHCAGRRVDHLPRITRATGPSADQLDNLILWSDLDDTTVDEEIDAQVAHFHALGHNFEWISYGHDRPLDLVDRLLARGFEVESRERVVIASAQQIGHQPPPRGTDVRRIADAAQVIDAVAVQDEVWGRGHHDFLTRWLTDLVVDFFEESIVVVAYGETGPVASAWSTLWNDRAFAPLFGGSVLPAWRGRGIYRALVAARAQAAVARGIQWCFADAGTDSFPILQRLGFELFTHRTCLRWTAGTPTRSL